MAYPNGYAFHEEIIPYKSLGQEQATSLRFQAVPSAEVIMLHGSASVVIVGPEGISTGSRGIAESYAGTAPLHNTVHESEV